MGSVDSTKVNIIDIRRDKTEQSLLDLVKRSIQPDNDVQPSLPTLLLYDQKGLKIFEDITYLDEYYLTNAEIETLTKHADAIAARVPAGSRLIELGSGNLRKVDILLEAFERAQKPVDYYALDLSLSELHRTFAEINVDKYQHVSLNALHGTYDDGLAWLEKPGDQAQTTCVMTLGSSIGNFSRNEASRFLSGFKDALSSSDLVLVGLDACQNEQRVFAAYNDSKSLTEHFYRNGLNHANQLLGYEAFKQSDWAVEGSYDNVEHRHQASYRALVDIKTKDFAFAKGQNVLLEYAYKYSGEQSDELWHSAGLIPQATYGNIARDYNVHLLSPSKVNFPNKPSQYAATPIPTVKDWEKLWSAWDTVTKSMVPRDELMNKPIKLRNNLIFYLGHIPTFADIHFVKATGAKPTDPAHYSAIFERGIDPDVDNPEVCHDHSEIPDSWPPLEEILDHAFRVRRRIIESTESGEALRDRKLGRGLWLAYEHEAMHLETFLYMLLQSSQVLPPPGQDIPDFAALAYDARKLREENEWHVIPNSKVVIGLDDPENDLPPTRYFGWDVECPSRTVQIPKFKAQSRCISNGEYARFLEENNLQDLPAAWNDKSDIQNVVHLESSTDDDATGTATPSAEFLEGKTIRTVYGLVPLKYALDWPLMASYDELAAYAKWAGGRIPTFEEARSIYSYVDGQEQLKTEKVSSNLISAVNGHLSNDGVEETPPSYHSSPKVVNGPETSIPNPNGNFVNLNGCNVAFEAWHPTPVTGEGHRLRGQSDAGGLWEWTSSPLRSFDGYKPMDLYPGYSSDFFDEKHNICLGGSWATVPRIAGRKSFVNWYQRNYPYTWATARLVRDAD